MKRFEIIIKDLEKGETIKKIKTNCIIGAVSDADDNKVVSIGLTETNLFEILKTIQAAEDAIQEIKESIRKKDNQLNNNIIDFLDGLKKLLGEVDDE